MGVLLAMVGIRVFNLALAQPRPPARSGRRRRAKRALGRRFFRQRSALPGVLLLVLMAVLTLPREALAWGEDRLRGVYAPAGIVLGAGLHPDRPNGFVLGLEQSLVGYAGTKQDGWAGVYMDGLYDFGPRRARFSLGPEAGWGVLGVDAGWLIQVNSDTVQSGLTGRLLLTTGIVTLYGRLGTLLGAQNEPYFFESGLLLKYPFEVGALEHPLCSRPDPLMT